jgi:bacterioferritin
MIKENLVAERIAIDSYREIGTYFAAFDSTTRKMIEEIQAEEEEHADDIADLLQGLNKDIKRSRFKRRPAWGRLRSPWCHCPVRR